jgi:hypothetical protein
MAKNYVWFNTTHRRDDGTFELDIERGVVQCPECERWFDWDSTAVNLDEEPAVCVLCLQGRGQAIGDPSRHTAAEIREQFNGWYA